jgi:hypothetical protein
MKKLVSKLALASLLAAAAASGPTAAHASVTLTTAKVVRVTQTSTRTDPNFGPYIIMTVEFDRAIGTGCTSNTLASVAMFQLADNAARDQNVELMSGLRQIATSGLLSGRFVRVYTAGACSAIGGQTLDYLALQ